MDCSSRINAGLPQEFERIMSYAINYFFAKVYRGGRKEKTFRNKLQELRPFFLETFLITLLKPAPILYLLQKRLDHTCYIHTYRFCSRVFTGLADQKLFYYKDHPRYAKY